MFRSWVAFCDSVSSSHFPADERIVALFLASLSLKGLRAASITKYLGIVRVFFLANGHSWKFDDSFLLRQVLRGTRRVNAASSAAKAGVTPAMLLQFRRHLDLTDPFDAAVWAAMLVAFFSFLRSGNLLPPSASRFESGRHLSFGDFNLYDGGFELSLRRTKTIQFNDRVLIVPVASIPGSPLCPVVAVSNSWLLSHVERSSLPAFSYRSRSGSLTTLTKPRFVAALKNLCSLIGLDPASFSGHSFRRGGATFAHAVGVPDGLIQLQGDWVSDAYKQYISVSVVERRAASSTMAASLDPSRLKRSLRLCAGLGDWDPPSSGSSC